MKLILIALFFSTAAIAQQTSNKLTVKELDVTSRVNVTSTTKSSKPCPAMTETQRNAIATPLNGSCIYNTTTLKLNVYNGTVWKAAGGGVDNWLTATAYSVDDIVIESSKIYQCLIAHTSGTFATDLAASRWVEISSTVPVNLTGPITSVGNATSIASQTGTGSTFVVQNTPTLTTPNIGAATGTSLTLAGNISAYNYDKDNLLVNGNIENPLSSEWTCTVGTCTRTTTAGEFSKDTAALKVALSAQAMNVSQTVTTPSGIQKQGFARVIYRVPSTMADFKVCTLVDGSEQTCSGSEKLVLDDTFRSIEIPLTFGSTSAGIKFKTTSSYTANAYFDGVILSQGLGLQNLSLDTSFVQYTPTFVSFGTPSNVSIWWRRNGEYLEMYGYFTAGTTASAIGSISLPSGLRINTAKTRNTARTQTFGTFNRIVNASLGAFTAGAAGVFVYDGTNDDRIQPAWYVGSNQTQFESSNVNSYHATGDSMSFTGVRIPIVGWDGTANVYSQASGNYSFTSGGTITVTATTTNPTKGTLVTDSVIHQRNGQNMKAIYKFHQSTGGSNGSGDYLFTLPDSKQFDSSYVNFYTGDVAGTGSGVDAQKALIGWGTIGNGSARGHCDLYAYSATQFRARCDSAFSVQVFFGSAHYGYASAFGFSWHIDAPISGWTNSSAIVGSFEGIEKCANTLECMDTFSAYISTSGVKSNENYAGWLNAGPFTPSSSVYNLTMPSGIFTVNPNCTVTGGVTGANRNWYVNVTSPTAVSVNTFNGASLGDIPFTISCQRAGVDSKPKTAKVASSIGVPTVPGVTTEAIDTFSVSYGTTNATTVCSASPCSYLDQIGSAVTSITRSAAGNYTVNLGKTYTKLKGIPSAASVGAGSIRVPEIIQCSNCSSVSFKTLGNTGADGDSSGTIFFQGTY